MAGRVIDPRSAGPVSDDGSESGLVRIGGADSRCEIQNGPATLEVCWD
jgi:hypothetical protein